MTSTPRRAANSSIRLMLLLLAGMLTSLSAHARDRGVDSGYWDTRYDHLFRKYSQQYFGPHFDWRWFKAQAIAESNLNNKARSHVGARGVMQLMPATFKEIRETNPHFESLSHAEWNIAAGIYYVHYLYKRWSHIPSNDRLLFAMASYNAGYWRVLQSSHKPGFATDAWDVVSAHVPPETSAYVARIRRLKAGGRLPPDTLRLRSVTAEIRAQIGNERTLAQVD